MSEDDRPKRRRWPWIVAGLFILILLAGGNESEDAEPVYRDTPGNQRAPAEIPAVEEVAEEPAVAVERAVPKFTWTGRAREFTVVEDEDISSSNRARRRVFVVSLTAQTREDRITTLIEATKVVWGKYNSQFIGMFLLPFESGPVVARINYAPDKCGVSGEDCTDRMWTEAYASDAVFTPEQKEIYMAWESNKDRFKEIDKDYGFEAINEDHLKAYLGERFGMSPEEISTAYLEVSMSAVLQEKVSVPVWFDLQGQLSEQEQEKANAVACRASLQCWGDKHSVSASVYCPRNIERLAKYDHEWTDGWLGLKFSKFSWKDRTNGVVTYFGDQIKFQNGFGAWVPHIYQCDLDTINDKVLDVRAFPGRL